MNPNIAMTPCHLPTMERNVLHRIWLAFAGQVFDEEKLFAQSMLPFSGAEVMTAFLGLRQKGWICAVKKAWGERLYFIPTNRLYSVQAAFYTPSPKLADVPAVSLLFEAKPGLALDVFNTLVYTAKNEGLPLTSKGTLHKKHIQKLNESEGLTSADVSAIGLEYAHSDVYPPLVAVLLDLMLSLGLLFKESHAFVLKKDALQEWLHLTMEEMNRLLFQSVMERYGRNNPGSQHFRQVLCHEAFKEDIWYDVNQLLDEMLAEGMLKTEDRSSLYEEGVAWIRFLAGAGWADVGTANKEDCFFRWKVSAAELLQDVSPATALSASSHLFIQPDYEVLVPPDTPFTVRWSLALCSDRVSVGHMSVYRLTKDSVALAADLGMRPDQVTEFITEQALAGVPDNVAAALAQWGREVGRTFFAELTVLQCESADEGDQIAAHPKLTEWIHRLGPLHFAVRTDRVSDIRKVLNIAGLPPKRQVGGFEQVFGSLQSEEVRSEQDDQSGRRYFEGDFNHFLYPSLVYSGRNEHYYELDLDVPNKESLFPDLAKVPVMWTRDWRTYHGTTAKQIMEQALDWKMRLELGINNTRIEFIPLRLFRNPWRVSGALFSPDVTEPEMVELSDGDWQEMRLVIPDLSRS